ncbi:alpha-L-arabinofuranosidase [Microdochium trichocladiopsis]|uniref:non-reducing end alpha-L-arabinofuranosidase n=1 Tax=Microdochium trichocladiopsis TaxID=1682393 RepID=A0A9P8Y2R4_9PEZI|nr:alpha-L-arabinofuranosidase [Microdochium trichocladiopsis]KAH7027828.1 alpha-L-arabinofuranosidase [Microdochium trichocladiopsis]
MHPSNSVLLAAWLAWTSLPTVSAIDITVKADGGNATNGHQYGFLHEDINNSGDGGLYAELIRNRAFQASEGFPSTLDAWYSIGGASLSLKKLEKPLSEALSTSLNVAPSSGGYAASAGFFNDGYWGMDVKKANKYTGSFWVKGQYDGQFTASFRSNITGDIFGSTTIQSKSVPDDWTEHTYELRPEIDAPNSNNTLAITFDSSVVDGSLDFNLISLFPPTFKGRKNGMRIDIAEALADLHPTLFRIPGGNMLEGQTNSSWWDWKDSLGPLKDRPGFGGVWNYPQTHGLGLLEYLELSEDLDMELVVGVYSGLSLNGDITPEDQLQFFIDDALDQIEFIRGPIDSKWGARRAELGHPKPFKLRYVEIGNEDWLAGRPTGWETYKEYRFPMFLEAINAAYPDIQVIASGSIFDGHDIPKPGAGDYHLYAEPDTLIKQFGRFDNVETPHIIGEMAATHPNGGTSWDGPMQPWPWWSGSVAEAVGLISYERNQDRIIGAAYAPVLRNLNRWQWPITIVHHAADPALTTKSTSWFIWELFAGHVFTETLPATSEDGFGPLYYVTGKNDITGGHIFKGALFNSTDNADVPVRITFEGVQAGTQAELTLLSGPENPYGYNDPWTGINVVETTKSTLIADAEGVFSFEMPNLSVALLDTAPKYGRY